MRFNDYQKQTRSTAIYPGAGKGDLISLSYVALGLGEAGEVQNVVKKIIRDNDGVVSDEKRQALFKELGDLQWYVARLADELGFNLGDVAEANLDKLNDRAERGVIKGSGDNR